MFSRKFFFLFKCFSFVHLELFSLEISEVFTATLFTYTSTKFELLGDEMNLRNG